MCMTETWKSTSMRPAYSYNMYVFCDKAFAKGCWRPYCNGPGDTCSTRVLARCVPFARMVEDSCALPWCFECGVRIMCEVA